jgi:hypothetical protein
MNSAATLKATPSPNPFTRLQLTSRDDAIGTEHDWAVYE